MKNDLKKHRLQEKWSELCPTESKGSNNIEYKLRIYPQGIKPTLLYSTDILSYLLQTTHRENILSSHFPYRKAAFQRG